MKPLQPTLAPLWDQFLDNANLGDLHDFDLDRFAAFVRTAHHPTHRKDPIDFRQLLGDRIVGMDPDDQANLVTRLEDLYLFGRKVLGSKGF